MKEEIAMNKEERQLSQEEHEQDRKPLEESSSSSTTSKCRIIDTTAQNRGKRYLMFIPHELEIEGRPKLSKFPLNVLFADYTIRDGVRAMGSALYEPDLLQFGAALNLMKRDSVSE